MNGFSVESSKGLSSKNKTNEITFTYPSSVKSEAIYYIILNTLMIRLTLELLSKLKDVNLFIFD